MGLHPLAFALDRLLPARPGVEDLRTMPRPGQFNHGLVCAKGLTAAPPQADGPVFQASAGRLLEAARRVAAKRLNVAEAASDPAIGQVVFVQRTAFLRFPDIVRVQAIPAPGGQTALAVFCRAVYGFYDFGVNRRRARSWARAIAREMAPG
ncbi:MAG: DUF1499 domain-containing protein [Rhodospirillales bacterium]